MTPVLDAAGPRWFTSSSGARTSQVVTTPKGSWLAYLLFISLSTGGPGVAGVTIALAADKGGYFILLGAAGVVAGIASMLPTTSTKDTN